MKSRTGMRIGEYFRMYIEIRKAGSYCHRKSYGGFSRSHCCLTRFTVTICATPIEIEVFNQADISVFGSLYGIRFPFDGN